MVVVALVGWGQVAAQKSRQRSSIRLAAAQSENARIEKVEEESRQKLEEVRALRVQLQNDKRGFARELGSFKRPAMRKALLEQLQLPANCVVSSSMDFDIGYREVLIYSSDPGQQLVIPVWYQSEKFDTNKLAPDYKVIIDVPPGELNILKLGLTQRSDDSEFIVRFSGEEKLKIDLPRFNGRSTTSGGQNELGPLLPNVVASRKFAMQQPDIVLDLLQQGIWLQEHDNQWTITESKTGAKTHLAFCLYWKSSQPLYAVDAVLPYLPLDPNDPAQVEFDSATGLHKLILPTAKK